MDTLIDLDTWLLLAINGFNSEYADPLVKAFSGRTPWIFMYISIACVMWWKYGWRHALVMIVSTGIAVGLADFICASVIRPEVHRLRPSNPDNEISHMVHIVDGYRSGAYGFPSCHACNTFALSVISALWLRERKYTVFILIWAVLQCYSRIYLGVHYPGDIAVGAIVGAAISYAVYRLAAKISARYLQPPVADAKATTIPVIIVGILTTLVIAGPLTPMWGNSYSVEAPSAP